ncbi:hypothetical protein RND71_030683 [Anisodus tanguticus]|uniref:Uncharacterized protein n=1 Tax=Anisodus tanguticus TaxID=243964 RepID=A0AAE1V8H3_9SOLA|nr:hypothetical protein RND71_030683 [Anisodus tanguticus]
MQFTMILASSSRPNVDNAPLEERYVGLNINDVRIELDYVDDEDVSAYEKHEDNPQFCIISRVLDGKRHTDDGRYDFERTRE